MEDYHLAPTALTPEVRLSPREGLLTIRGESYPEHVLSFYAPIMAKIQAVLEAGQLSLLKVEMHITYYNSASAKAFHRIFQMLNSAAETGCTVNLHWQYDSEDEMARDLGRDLREDFGAIQVVDVPLVAV
jgi:hypothetical protein